MPKLLRPSTLAPVALLLFAGAAVLAAPAGCSVQAPGEETADSESSALAGVDAVARAEQWVSAQLHYCQAANHQRDYDNACSTYCNRTDNPAWDPYRSDCSGLISWAWGLPAPGRVTTEFAPFTNDISHTISASSLAPGDALNNDEHVMLFKAWVTPGQRAVLIEEPGCATAITHAHEFTAGVSISGSTVSVNGYSRSFTAIRYDGFGSGSGSGGGSSCVYGGLYCGGDKVGGDHNTLYKCNAPGSPSVQEICANGCSVNAGQNDSCKSGSATSGGTCVQGGLYCGGDKVSGDHNTLYRCNGPGTPSVVQQCSNGCSVNSGSDDSCNGASAPPPPPPPSGGNCVAGGLYCGGDKVSGSSNTLYRCNGSSAPTALGSCSDGCEVLSGQNDACRGSGGCSVGGLYCGGDKVTGDPRTLYKCTGGSSGTVVSHCANSCSVIAGANDVCH